MGAFGSYSLGANNIANVVGVFVPSAPNITIDFGFFTLDGVQILFLLGGLSIAVGILTYSKKVMMTVGNAIMELNAETAIVVVLAHSLVLFVFSSQSLSDLFVRIGLPAIPMVPVSSSQAIVGSVLGIGLLKGGRRIRMNVIGKIAMGWLVTPLIAGLIAFFALFFMSNVFNMKVSEKPSRFERGIVIRKDKNTEKAAGTFQVETVKVSDTEDKTNVLNVYKPFVILTLVALVALIVYLLYRIQELKDRNKLDEYQESIDRYDAQQSMLENELKLSQEAKKRLQKEIESKEKEQKKIALSIIRKNEILSKLKAEIENLKNKPEGQLSYNDLNTLKVLILDNLNLEKERKSLDKYIQELNDTFYQNLDKKYPGLTDNEKKLCSLLRLKLTSKEIASILNISTKSVEVNRYRLRKKMKLGKDEKLTKVIRKL